MCAIDNRHECKTLVSFKKDFNLMLIKVLNKHEKKKIGNKTRMLSHQFYSTQTGIPSHSNKKK